MDIFWNHTMQSFMVLKIWLRKESPMTCGMWLLVFDQLWNAFNGNKIISRGYSVWQIFSWKMWKGEEVNLIMWKEKIWRVGGVTTEIPSMVGVWIFSGNTNSGKTYQDKEYCIYMSQQGSSLGCFWNLNSTYNSRTAACWLKAVRFNLSVRNRNEMECKQTVETRCQWSSPPIIILHEFVRYRYSNPWNV